MGTLFYVHWNESECKARVAELVTAGYLVRGHFSTGEGAKITEPYPVALVLSLDRLPSHGRSIAEWFWEAKKRQHIPIIFEGGAEEKIRVTRAKFPKAVFCASGKVEATLESLGLKP